MTELPSLKPLYLTKKQIKPDKITDYLTASATLFPMFKSKVIGKKSLIDGGYTDNLPINLAIKMGADEIIAVNLGTIGRTQKVQKTDIPITIIKPNNGLDFFLKFNRAPVKRALNLGYNDTMKKFNYFEGDFFTFKKGSLNKNYRYYKKYYQRRVDDIVNNYKKNYSKKDYNQIIHSYQKENNFNQLLESLGKMFKLDDEKIYRADTFNSLLRKSFIEINNKRDIIDNDDINNLINIYEKIDDNLKPNKLRKFNQIIGTNIEDFIKAIYLKTIINDSPLFNIK